MVGNIFSLADGLLFAMIVLALIPVVMVWFIVRG